MIKLFGSLTVIVAVATAYSAQSGSALSIVGFVLTALFALGMILYKPPSVAARAL